MLKNTIIKNGDDMNDIINYFTEYISQDKPLFFSRVGGTDFYTVGEYFTQNTNFESPEWRNDRIKTLKAFNGYFDFNNDMNVFHKYLKDMVRFYKNSDDMFYCGGHLIDSIKNDNLIERDETILNYVADGKTITHYGFLENVKPFLKSFTTWGKDKKILIISPLSKSIEYQYKNKDNLYVDYKFPEFELKTYNTKITYSTNADTHNTLNVTTNNWNEECIKMAIEIEKIDFDIAFLSCASYSMFLGDFIKHQMKKKSIYIGGILNVFFNIYGGRFKTYFGASGLNSKYEINPFENEDIKNIRGGRHGGWSESLNAYFGYR
jgi:hypothetical protein